MSDHIGSIPPWHDAPPPKPGNAEGSFIGHEEFERYHQLSDERARLVAGPMAPPYSAPDPTRLDLPSGSVSRWVGEDPPELRFTVDKLVPEGMVTLLAGEGGAGKTFLMQLALTSVAASRSFLKRDSIAGNAVGVFAEDPDAVLHHRQCRINKHLSVEMDGLANALYVKSLSGSSSYLWKDNGATPLMAALEQELEGIGGVRLICLDNAALLFCGDEINRVQVTGFINHLNGVASRLGAGIILSTHVSKSSDGSVLRAVSGSTAWINASRSVLLLEVKSDDEIELRQIKANISKKAEPISLFWTEGVLDAVPAESDLIRNLRTRQLERLVLEKIDEAWRRDNPLSDTPQSRDRYLPPALARQSGFKAADVKKVMVGLLDGGVIVPDQRTTRLPRGLRVADEAYLERLKGG